MNKKRIKMTMVTMMTCGIMLAESITAFAESAYAQSAGDAGSARVTVEVGFNGTHAYAAVSATNYVDADMEGTAVYQKDDEYGFSDLSGNFYQNTFGQVEKNCAGNVIQAYCMFDVTSDDGSWSNSLVAR